MKKQHSPRSLLVAGMATCGLLAITTGVASAQDSGASDSHSDGCSVVSFTTKRLIAPNVEYTEAVPISFHPGSIAIPKAEAGDGYFNRHNVTQSSERYELQFLDANGTVVATSEPTPDVPDMVEESDTEYDLGVVELTEDIVAVRAHHRPDIAPDGSPNSVNVGTIEICPVAVAVTPETIVVPSTVPASTTTVPAPTTTTEGPCEEAADTNTDNPNNADNASNSDDCTDTTCEETAGANGTNGDNADNASNSDDCTDTTCEETAGANGTNGTNTDAQDCEDSEATTEPPAVAGVTTVAPSTTIASSTPAAADTPAVKGISNTAAENLAVTGGNSELFTLIAAGSILSGIALLILRKIS